MSEQPAEDSATEAEASDEQQQEHSDAEQPKPSETVDFWKKKAREQEKRAKENATAAKRLADLEDAQKSESEKAADRIAKAESEAATVPSKVADALRGHLVELHGINSDDAELFLTAEEPELLLKQVKRLVEQSDSNKSGTRVPREGRTPNPTPPDDRREFADFLTGNQS